MSLCWEGSQGEAGCERSTSVPHFPTRVECRERFKGKPTHVEKVEGKLNPGLYLSSGGDADGVSVRIKVHYGLLFKPWKVRFRHRRKGKIRFWRVEIQEMEKTWPKFCRIAGSVACCRKYHSKTVYRL